MFKRGTEKRTTPQERNTNYMYEVQKVIGGAKKRKRKE